MDLQFLFENDSLVHKPDRTIRLSQMEVRGYSAVRVALLLILIRLIVLRLIVLRLIALLLHLLLVPL